MKHTSVESEDLPTYFRSQYQWTQSARTSPAPAKGRKAVLNAVSSEAPISFQIKHAQVLTPERKRAALLGSAAKPSRDQRLMQDLNSHSATRFLRFTYSDFRSTTDLNSIPLGRGVDLLTDHNAGARSRLPFYKEHAKAWETGGFKVRQDIFCLAANQRIVRRTDANLLSSLQKAPKGKSPTHYRINTDLSRVCSPSLRVASPFNSVSTRYTLQAPRKPRSTRQSLAKDIGSVESELRAFDRRLLSTFEVKPMTRLSLGLS